MTTKPHTARPHTSALGFTVIMDGPEMLTSFWAWDLRAVTKDPKTGQTQLCFRDSMWLPTTAGVADVMAAVSAAMAAYSAIDRKMRAA